MNKDFQVARNPFTSSHEIAGRHQQEGESEEESPVLNEWYARSCRLQPLIEHLTRLQEAGWEAEILLSKDASKQVSEATRIFRSSFADLASAIQGYFQEEQRRATRRGGNIDQNWLNSLFKTIYSQPDDAFSKQIDQATDKLASALKAYVK